MALILKDRVKETCSAPGTGTVSLLGAATGYQAFSAAIGNGNTTYYTIQDQTGPNWEVGLGTYSSSGNTLARTTVLASSNSGSLVDFSSGTQDVWVDYPAGKAVYADASNKLRVDGNPYVDFEDATGTTVAAGRMWYDNGTGSWNLGMGGGNITQQVGEEIFIYGKASAAITEGQLVMKTGVVGASGVITFAPTTAGLTDDQVIIGIATENIPLNGFGRVTAFGVVHGIDTSAFADGDTLWYNPAAGSGAMTATKPTAPNVKCEVGIVINAGSGGSGSIQVEIIHGTSLGGTDSNVNITSVANGNILTYDGANSYWKNTDLTAGTGISISKSANGVLTVTNTSPSSGGTVTSVTGTAPIASSGGTTPDISISQATTSTNGYLSSTDWNTFNNKQDLLVSGTNIKTINSSSILGSGNLSITASPAGSDTQIQYNNSGSFAGNASFTINTSTGDNKAPVQNSTNGISVNSESVSANYTIATGSNGFSVGPVTVASGVTVTVSAGQRWVVI